MSSNPSAQSKNKSKSGSAAQSPTERVVDIRIDDIHKLLPSLHAEPQGTFPEEDLEPKPSPSSRETIPAPADLAELELGMESEPPSFTNLPNANIPAEIDAHSRIRMIQQAQQIAAIMREKRNELDRRESRLNAREAAHENEVRAFRIWVEQTLVAAAKVGAPAAPEVPVSILFDHAETTESEASEKRLAERERELEIRQLELARWETTLDEKLSIIQNAESQLKKSAAETASGIADASSALDVENVQLQAQWLSVRNRQKSLSKVRVQLLDVVDETLRQLHGAHAGPSAGLTSSNNVEVDPFPRLHFAELVGSHEREALVARSLKLNEIIKSMEQSVIQPLCEKWIEELTGVSISSLEANATGTKLQKSYRELLHEKMELIVQALTLHKDEVTNSLLQLQQGLAEFERAKNDFVSQLEEKLHNFLLQIELLEYDFQQAELP